MSDFFSSEAFRNAKIGMGLGEVKTHMDFGKWEPEDGECFPKASHLVDMYDVLAQCEDIVMFDAKQVNYNILYITLGLSTPSRHEEKLGYTIRSRFNFDQKNNEIKYTKFCIKSAGKETTRQEFQSGRTTLCVEGNMQKLITEHPDLPSNIREIKAKELLVDSAQSISRSGFFFGHRIPEAQAVIWYAGSLDVCHHSIPSVYRDVKREKIVVCGERNEGEYEAIGVDVTDPTYMDKKGIESLVHSSLTHIKRYLAQSGLPIVPSHYNKVEDARASAARYFEEEYGSVDGQIGALAQNMRPKDYRRSYMKAALGILSRDLPPPGTLCEKRSNVINNGFSTIQPPV